MAGSPDHARPDGVSDFDRLHSRRHDGEVQLLGFDLLELDGVDLRLGAFGPAQGCVGQAAASVARRRRDAPHPTTSRDWEDRFS